MAFVIFVRIKFALYEVVGTSMFPSIVNGDMSIVRITQDVKRGDIIVFKYKGASLCKRVVGIPGDTVFIYDDHDIVYDKNGQIVDDEKHYVLPWLARSGVNVEQWNVSKDQLFVLGDARLIALDSRIFGTIPAKAVIGKIVWILGRKP